MQVAIVHDWLTTYAGAERVLEQMLNLFPEADVFTVVDFLPEKQRFFLRGKTPITSSIQRWPRAKKNYRNYLPLMPLAVEQFDLSSYDVILSCSHAVAKGVLTGPDQLHICYIHTPIRYAWDLQHQYLKEAGLDQGLKGYVAKAVLHYIRNWDYRTANGVDYFVANSGFIARRVWKVYRREANVIYPPVNVDKFQLCEDKEDFYLTASRFVPYKKLDLIVEAFNQMPEKKLIIIGDGPDYNKVRSKAMKNITLLGFQPSDVLRDYMQKAKAFVFAAEEDFGIAPVEAQACGTPVIAFGKGGALETIKGLTSEKPTGVFFLSQTSEAIIEAINIFENTNCSINPITCRENALRFSPERFRKEFSAFVTEKMEKFHCERNSGS